MPGVQRDVDSMFPFFLRRGFEVPTPLRDRTATASAVLGAIESAASQFGAGDLFVFYFAGHGADRPGGGDERFDQMLMTSDQPILDDQLGALWPRFAADVRIVVITDSCHSGSSVRRIDTAGGTERDINSGLSDIAPPRWMGIGLPEQSTRDVRPRDGNIEGLRGSLLHIAACLDRQQALDLGSHGFFTDALLKAWAAGTPASYDQMFDRIKQTMSTARTQTPLMTSYGPFHSTFRGQAPFDLAVRWPPERPDFG